MRTMIFLGTDSITVGPYGHVPDQVTTNHGDYIARIPVQRFASRSSTSIDIYCESRSTITGFCGALPSIWDLISSRGGISPGRLGSRGEMVSRINHDRGKAYTVCSPAAT